MRLNRRIPNGMYGGVKGRLSASYPIVVACRVERKWWMLQALPQNQGKATLWGEKTVAESTAVICIVEFASLQVDEPSGVDGFSYVDKGLYRDVCSQRLLEICRYILL